MFVTGCCLHNSVWISIYILVHFLQSPRSHVKVVSSYLLGVDALLQPSIPFSSL